ncbi:MAG: tetratricopeptide repeat protein [Thermodesulfobacteria bacterium]|nr:tetratricopeptide repeat protein [Thermodesulfobacteriota bacterium]
MKKRHLLSLVLVCSLLTPSMAFSHGDISKFPPSVQILQYKMALYMNPDDLETRNKLGIAYWLANRLKEAQKEFQAVLEKDPRNFNALDGMGLVLLKAGDLKSALSYFNKAEEINPSDVLVHVHKAVTFERMGKDESAQEEFAKAKSLATDLDREKIDKELELLKKTG